MQEPRASRTGSPGQRDADGELVELGKYDINILPCRIARPDPTNAPSTGRTVACSTISVDHRATMNRANNCGEPHHPGNPNGGGELGAAAHSYRWALVD